MRLEHLLSGETSESKGSVMNRSQESLVPAELFDKYIAMRIRPSGMVLLTVLELSWLERYTDNVEVGSSTLPGTTSPQGNVL